MDFWTNSYVWIFIFATAFLVVLKEWFTAHDIIDRLMWECNQTIKKMKHKHWEEITRLESENQNYKRRLGID